MEEKRWFWRKKERKKVVNSHNESTRLIHYVHGNVIYFLDRNYFEALAFAAAAAAAAAAALPAGAFMRGKRLRGNSTMIRFFLEFSLHALSQNQGSEEATNSWLKLPHC